MPFCRSRCGYCSFYSAFLASSDDVGRYKGALLQQLRLVDFPAATTIYFGGGTPSLFPPDFFATVVTEVMRRAGAAPLEVTVECNPDISEEYIVKLQRAGVTRLSVGVQSADPATLKWLKRDHGVSLNKLVCRLRRAQQVGLQVSVDFIAGIPGTTVGQVSHEMVPFTFVDHISLYTLDLPPSHPQARLLNGDFQYDSFMAAQEYLGGCGFVWYEISNFCRPGKASRHNSLYWRGQPYLALGSGAAGFSGKVRYRVPADSQAYMAAQGCVALAIDEFIDEREALREQILLGLRTSQGIEARLLPPEQLEMALNQGLLEALPAGRVGIPQHLWLNYNEVVGRLGF
ncbi:oxygen-independent coproporphyrinogen-3 oxidase [Desulfurispira natronophila]|uniref:Oxygen-independent coproporphyrinogen-3 oxidase n=2 Tax=Desulfurispira natronophila TaxID=682562 RepID=A0A7W8DH03_9BACT|nr:coproporphyrinogen-III oxidase family protein [Desulfurispira natronophila]MBB5021899.1 oxygen-independent coproporphyrinogen-3 oxidase [Desulfurispira natronophila]